MFCPEFGRGSSVCLVGRAPMVMITPARMVRVGSSSSLVPALTVVACMLTTLVDVGGGVRRTHSAPRAARLSALVWRAGRAVCRTAAAERRINGCRRPSRSSRPTLGKQQPANGVRAAQSGFDARFGIGTHYFSTVLATIGCAGGADCRAVEIRESRLESATRTASCPESRSPCPTHT